MITVSSTKVWWRLNDRVIADYNRGRGSPDYYTGTIRKEKPKVTVEFDDGEVQEYAQGSKHIVARAINKRNEESIPKSKLKDWTEIPWRKGDRLIAQFEGDYFIGTVTKYTVKTFNVEFDDGEEHQFNQNEPFLQKGIGRKNPDPINEKDLGRWRASKGRRKRPVKPKPMKVTIRPTPKIMQQAVFDRLRASVIELLNDYAEREEDHKKRAYLKAAQVMAEMPHLEFVGLHDSGGWQLLHGIGQSISDKINKHLAKAKIPKYSDT